MEVEIDRDPTIGGHHARDVSHPRAHARDAHDGEMSLTPEEALAELVVTTSKDHAERMLATMNRARMVAPTPTIARWLAEDVESAAVAAGISGDAALAPLLAQQLEASGAICQHAALALGAARHRQFTQAIVTRLADVDTFHASAFVVALELMNDASVAPQLIALMKKWGARSWYDLNDALWRLTGREPLLTARAASPKAHARASAAAWERLIYAGPATPRFENVQSEDARTLTFDLVDGVGALRIDWEPPTPGSSWARWDRALYVHDTNTWNLGSTCGTCEAVLYRVGLPAQAIADAAERVRSGVANMTTLDASVLQVIAPYLHVLRTGAYLARLVDLDLVRVDRPEDSWLTRRVRVRDPNAAASPDDVHDLRAAHFQTRTLALRQPRRHDRADIRRGASHQRSRGTERSRHCELGRRHCARRTTSGARHDVGRSASRGGGACGAILDERRAGRTSQAGRLRVRRTTRARTHLVSNRRQLRTGRRRPIAVAARGARRSQRALTVVIQSLILA